MKREEMMSFDQPMAENDTLKTSFGRFLDERLGKVDKLQPDCLWKEEKVQFQPKWPLI